MQYAVDRYTNETHRIYGVIDRRLGEAPYLAGDYSIADIATYSWLRMHEAQGQNLDEFPNLKRWYEAIEARPAVQRALKIMQDAPRTQPTDKDTRSNLFGARQFERR